jgi:hypothetical protein
MKRGYVAQKKMLDEKRYSQTLLRMTLSLHFKLWKHKKISVTSPMMQMVHADFCYGSNCNE